MLLLFPELSQTQTVVKVLLEWLCGEILEGNLTSFALM